MTVSGTYVPIVFTVVSVLLVSCSGSPSVPKKSTQPGPTPIQIDEATLHMMSGPNKAFQRSLLVENRLTFTAYVQCVQAVGGQVNDFMLTAAESYWMTVYTPAGPSKASVSKCDDEYWYSLARLWSLHHQPPPETIRNANAALDQCLRANGVTFPQQHPGARAFEALGGPGRLPPSALFKCNQQVGNQFKLPGFIGG